MPIIYYDYHPGVYVRSKWHRMPAREFTSSLKKYKKLPSHFSDVYLADVIAFARMSKIPKTGLLKSEPMCTTRVFFAFVTNFMLATAFLCLFLPDKIVEPRRKHVLLKREPLLGSSKTPVVKGCHDVIYGNYCVMSFPSEAERFNSNMGSVTLCTQGTVGFLQHVSVLCQRWGGPISLAVYSPPPDYQVARTQVATLRHCDSCVRHWVSWHFFLKQNLGDPSVFGGSIYVDDQEKVKDCSALGGGNWTEERKSKGAYPINVGRNIARQRTHTPYVFSLDIELYPSPNVLHKFDRMIRSRKNKLYENKPSNEVWALPVFEVHSGYSVPRTKYQLKKMFAKGQAISFHMHKCNACHMIPNLEGWFNQEVQWKSEIAESFDELRVWSTVKRTQKQGLHKWEPFFIGTREDPEFDIRLSWEGKENKKQMAYEMCLKDYSFHIVENAFLVHAPGIKVYNVTIDRMRIKYIEENYRYLKIIKEELNKTYGSTKDCYLEKVNGLDNL